MPDNSGAYLRHRSAKFRDFVFWTLALNILDKIWKIHPQWVQRLLIPNTDAKVLHTQTMEDKLSMTAVSGLWMQDPKSVRFRCRKRENTDTKKAVSAYNLNTDPKYLRPKFAVDTAKFSENSQPECKPHVHNFHPYFRLHSERLNPNPQHLRFHPIF
jgi:hypothetical protein